MRRRDATPPTAGGGADGGGGGAAAAEGLRTPLRDPTPSPLDGLRPAFDRFAATAATPQREELFDELGIDGGAAEYVSGLRMQIRTSQEENDKLRAENDRLRTAQQAAGARAAAGEAAPGDLAALRAAVRARRAEAEEAAAALREARGAAAERAAEVRRLDDERAQLRARVERADGAWREVAALRARLAELVREGVDAGLYPDGHVARTFDASFEYLLMGREVMRGTAQATAAVVRGCEGVTERVQREAAEGEERLRPVSAELRGIDEQLVARRARLAELPKGQARGRETEGILELYMRKMRAIERSAGLLRESADALGAAGAAARDAEAARARAERAVAPLRTGAETAYNNLEAFAGHIATFAAEHVKAEREKFGRHVAEAKEEMARTFASLSRRHRDYVASREKVVEARRVRLRALRSELEEMDEFDPRGERTTAEIRELDTEVATLDAALTAVRAVRGEAEGIAHGFADAVRKLPGLPTPLLGTDGCDAAAAEASPGAAGAKRKRGGGGAGGGPETPRAAKRAAGGEERPAARTPSQSPGARRWFFGLL